MGARIRRCLAAAALAVVGAAGLPAASLGDDPDADLAAKERSATLELYAIESELDRALADLAALRSQAAAITRERRSVGARVRAARDTIEASERFLGLRLRALYEGGETDPVAVFFGAESLQEALDDLEGLHYAAEQDRAIIERTQAVKRDLAGLARTLSGRSRELARLTATAEERTADLVRARAERSSTLRQIKAERGARAAARAARQAASARTRTERLVVTTTIAEAAPPPAPVQGADGSRQMTVISTGYALPGFTATGLPVGWGIVAVDPRVIPLGTRMTIPGYGEGVAADTGSAVKGAKIDLWFPTRTQALTWGIRTVTITLH